MTSSLRFNSVTPPALVRLAAACIGLATLLPATNVPAAQVSFRWDYTASGAAGFKLYCGAASRVYGAPVDVLNTDTYTLAGLPEGSTRYCAVTAYDAGKVESDYSNEVRVSVPYAVPSAKFSASPTAGTAPLTVTLSNTTTGTVSLWAWDFGDGTTSAAKNPTKVYNTPGSYLVKLKATGPGGTNTTPTTSISVSAPRPVPNFTMSPASGIAPLTVTFTNSTTGTVASWNWDFGDGTTSTVKSPTKVYSAAGSYAVKLTATGPGGSATKTASTPVSVTSGPPPVANFNVSVLSGTAPLSVAFTNLSTGTISGYLWEFGDGTTSTQASPTKVYTTPGSYKAKLTVTGPGGSNSLTMIHSINVQAPPPPVANFNLYVLSGTAPLSVAFTNLSTGTISGYLWEFGDGTTSTQASPTKVYTTPGSYKAKLTVTGPGGSNSLTMIHSINVQAPPPPVANFNLYVLSGTAPLSVAFTNLSTGTISGYLWEFGDGTTSTQASPTKVYTTPGSYKAKLTVTGPGGSNSLTMIHSITVR